MKRIATLVLLASLFVAAPASGQFKFTKEKSSDHLKESAEKVEPASEGDKFGAGVLPRLDSVDVDPEFQDETAGSIGRMGLRREVNRAMAKAMREGKITRKERRDVFFGMIRPATLERIENLAVGQAEDSDMVDMEGNVTYVDENGETKVRPSVFEVNDDGRIIGRERIDWSGLREFLEWLIPLILQIIAAFQAPTVARFMRANIKPLSQAIVTAILRRLQL